MNSQTICFTTLAMGFKYRQHALRLAQDIQNVANGTVLVVLTDVPSAFPKSDSIIAIKHSIQSVGVYHDKLCCLEECFRQGFDTCIFLDADCRILENVPYLRPWKIGITAKSCCALEKRLLNIEAKDKGFYERIDKIAQRYDVSIDHCKFIHEWMFIACKDQQVKSFFQVWREIRDSLEKQRKFTAEGIAIGMAAEIVGWPVYHYDTGYPEQEKYHQIIDIYKDRMFLQKELIPNHFKGKEQLLNQQRISIESQRPIVQKAEKVLNLIMKELRYWKVTFTQF